MRIKIDGRKVDVLEPQCRYRACLRIGHYTHHSAAGYSGASSQTAPSLSCLTRDERGCPPAEYRKAMTLEQWHGEEHEPRFPFTVHKGDMATVRCLECGKHCPRSMIIEWQERKEVSSA